MPYEAVRHSSLACESPPASPLGPHGSGESRKTSLDALYQEAWGASQPPQRRSDASLASSSAPLLPSVGRKGPRRGSSSSNIGRLTLQRMQLGLPSRGQAVAELDANALGGVLASKHALFRDLDSLNQVGVCMGVSTYMYLLCGAAAAGPFANGGAASFLYGFIFASIGSVLASASLAELTSACPTCSGLYFYTARLAPKRHMAYLSFCTGWLNVMGAVVSLALIAQVCANMALAFWSLSTLQPVVQTGRVFGSQNVTSVREWSGGHTPTTQYEALGFYWLVILLCGAINMVPIQVSAWFTSVSVFAALLGGPIMAVTMLCVAPTHQPASYVFGNFVLQTEVTGVRSPVLAFFMGTATSVGSLYGYDSSLYLVEESRNSTVSAPRGIFWGMVLNGVVGTLVMIAFLFCIQDTDALFDPSSVTGGQQWGMQLMWDAFAARYDGDGRGCLGLVAMIGLAQVLSLLLFMLGTARKVYAMARDLLLPRSDLFSAVSKAGVPVNAMLLLVALLMALGPLLLVQQNQVTLDRVISWVALVSYSSYLVPVVTRLLSSVQIRPGPFDLGRCRTSVLVIVAAFLVIAHVVLILPQAYPITWQNMNYGGPTWVLLLGLLHVWWFLPGARWGARHWARGPVGGVVAGVEYRL